MAQLEQQLHGYRHGHELLSSSMVLPKGDQALVDRLSDVAGPLSPGELFEPYVTCYPLTSGSHFVVARTWQDLNAPRAGCVRTRSLLVPMSDWMSASNVASILVIATASGPLEPSASVLADLSEALSLPAVGSSKGFEILEALFLEEREPIVVFDADQAELIAIRLLTALWPSLRKSFSVSTFARSPRLINQKSFDLVFASRDSRSRFASWKGRRIDGRKVDAGRHRWSESIAQRVFQAPLPSLRSLDLLGEMSTDVEGNEAALRISLLWDELKSKLEVSPRAALGLLDIANTRQAGRAEVLRALQPDLIAAATHAAKSLPPSEAWQFLLALTGKLHGSVVGPSVEPELREIATNLARKDPEEAVSKVSVLVDSESNLLIGAAGDGIAQALDTSVARRLGELEPSALIELTLASMPLSSGLLNKHSDLTKSLSDAFEQAESSQRLRAQSNLLPLLVSDKHADLARVLFAELDSEALVEELRRLEHVNGLASSELAALLFKRARDIGAREAMRDVVAQSRRQPTRQILHSLVEPNEQDLRWIQGSSNLRSEERLELTLEVVKAATKEQLRSMLSDSDVLDKTTCALLGKAGDASEAILKIARYAHVPPHSFVTLVLRLLADVDRNTASELAERALEVALPRTNDEVSLSALQDLLNATVSLNAARAYRVGLGRVSGEIATRNLLAFNAANDATRDSFVSAIEAMATVLADRIRIDISCAAATSAAELLWDANQRSPSQGLKASAALLPALMRATSEHISPLIAAAFPPVYHELREERVPDFMTFVFMFFDWDKCKTARRTLVDSYLRSEWRLIDLAVAAVRAGEGRKILGRVFRLQRGRGEDFQESIERDLVQLAPPLRHEVLDVLHSLRKAVPPDE